MEGWKKALIAAGGAAGLAAVVYYLLKEETDAGKRALVEADDDKKKITKTNPNEITKEQVHQILQDIITSQEQMKGYMKELTKELLTNPLSFELTYQRVKEVQPDDPLTKYGLSMVDFDQMLDKHQSDPNVREAIAKIMGAPNPDSCNSAKVQGITVKTIIEVHQFMLEELDNIVKNFQKLQNAESYDLKTVTIAAQAIVGSKIEAKFNLTSEDIESAVMMYHAVLATDKDFADTNIKIQHTMGKLMGQ